MAPGPGADARRRALAAGGRSLCRQLGLSSVHATFVPEAEMAAFEAEGYLHRTDQQFHFQNAGSRSGDSVGVVTSVLPSRGGTAQRV